MPSKSAKQAKLMRAAAHDAKFAKKAGVPQSVAKEFESADEDKADRKLVRAPGTGGPAMKHEDEEIKRLRKKGVVSAMAH